MTFSTDNSETSPTWRESFLGLLITDVFSSMERHQAADTQTSRRDLVRTTFAAIEGVVWTYREHVLDVAKSLNSITSAEEAAFSEISYQVSEIGKVVSQARFVPMPSLIRLTTRLAARLSPHFSPNFDGSGWEQFRRAIKIRNRIMHPKTESDLLISDRDLASCNLAFYWILELTLDGMSATNLALKGHSIKVRELVESLIRGDRLALAAYDAAKTELEK